MSFKFTVRWKNNLWFKNEKQIDLNFQIKSNKRWILSQVSIRPLGLVKTGPSSLAVNYFNYKCFVTLTGAGMRLFRFLADFRYFQGKFHHFCESSKSGLKFFRGGGEVVRRRSLDAISTTREAFTMFVRSTCVFRDVRVDGRNTEQSMTMFTYYRLFHWPTTPPIFLI